MIKKDSTVTDFGGFVIENVTKTIDTGAGKIEIIEKHMGPPAGEHVHMMQPVFFLYGLFLVMITFIIVFLGWVYLKKKSEIAKLMIQNNMSPAKLFGMSDREKGVGGFLKFGIISVAMGMSFLVDAILVSNGLFRYTAPVLFIFIGMSLIIIHVLNSKKK